jgi:2,3-diaminopropionate biosynthesis protein SbnB
MLDRVVPEFRVFSGADVRDVLDKDLGVVVSAVENAYRAHRRGETVNPDSYFLRFPGRESDRIIALPARYGSDGSGKTGIKWISSFPENVESGIARASAVLILNDEATGYPIACMEAGGISATRTAASAASALRVLNAGNSEPVAVTVVGTGVISARVLDFLGETGVRAERVVLHDRRPDRAEPFARYARGVLGVPVEFVADAGDAIRAGGVVVFATTAGAPHIHDASLFAHNPIVLHLSLRDLAPAVVLAAHNVVDDIDHALKARTSLHLTEMETGDRAFVAHTLPGLLSGEPVPERDKPVIFSPFGMGILDIALGDLVYSALADSTEPVENFYQGSERF